LLLGDVGPAQVQSDGLSANYPTQHEWCDGLTALQIDMSPQSLVTTPKQIHKKMLIKTTNQQL